MGTVFTFPGTHPDPDELGFRSDDTLSLSDLNLDSAPSVPVAPKRPTEVISDDWSNQELADLYRVKRILDQAGAICYTDRGLSDEGDPWFVFCGADGEVLIHVCRFDGKYVLDSPNLTSVLVGPDFDSLVSDYTRRFLPAEEDAEESKVVHLRLRSGRIALHPAVMLAALVWTLISGSEDGIALPGAVQQEGAAGAEIFAAPIQLAVPEHLEAEAGDARAIAADWTPGPDGVHPGERDQSGGHSNSLVHSLSTVAVALGFLTEHSQSGFSDTDRGDLAAAFELLKEVALDDAQSVAEASTAPQTAQIKALDAVVDTGEMMSQVEYTVEGGPSEIPVVNMALLAMGGVDLPVLPGDVPLAPLPDPVTGLSLWEPIDPEPEQDISSDEITQHKVTPPEKTAEKVATKDYSADLTHLTNGPAPVEVIDTTPLPPLNLFDLSSLSTFSIGANTVHASFEVTQSLLGKFHVPIDESIANKWDDLDTGPATDGSIELGALLSDSELAPILPYGMTQELRTTLESLLTADVDIDVAGSGDWLWIVETDAQYAPLAETVSLVHGLEDGSRVMITGLQSTFEDMQIVPA